MTRDDVIYALERCTCTVPDACVDCPMWEEGQSDYIACRTRLLREALALLKEAPRCTNCAHQSHGICASTGCPTRPDVWCGEWEART